MNINIHGICEQAFNELDEYKVLLEACLQDEDIKERLENKHHIDVEGISDGTIRAAMSSMHDSIVGVCQDKATLDELRVFMSVKSENEIYGDIVRFDR